jgi:hypothetical protein
MHVVTELKGVIPATLAARASLLATREGPWLPKAEQVDRANAGRRVSARLSWNRSKYGKVYVRTRQTRRTGSGLTVSMAGHTDFLVSIHMDAFPHRPCHVYPCRRILYVKIKMRSEDGEMERVCVGSPATTGGPSKRFRS